VPPRALRPSGLVLVDKPAGPSSFAVVSRLRRETGARAGHAGTLDPFASGLLLVFLGAATRLVRYLVGLDKRYVTEIDLTCRTTTGDPEGESFDQREPPPPDAVAGAVSALRGEVELRIPRASAVKIAGQRAYRLHRKGVEVEMPVRRSTIHERRLVAYRGSVVTLDLRVSSGTYVRAIADALGGHCVSLRRLEVGPFRVADADEHRLIPAVDALPFLPRIEVDGAEARAIREGRRRVDGAVRVVSGGELVAVGATVMPA
jgi:tRNA pseudouridine55 synthase